MFDNSRAYSRFSQLVRREDRFANSKEARTFVEEFCSQLDSRVLSVPMTQKFYRAANDYGEIKDEDGVVTDIRACGDGRMLPQTQYAQEQRASPSGIVVLYMATSAQTAISEIRPWLDDIISVVQVEITRKLQVVDLSRLHSEHQRLSWKGLMAQISDKPLMAEEINEIVWAEIDRAFSRPVTRTDTGAEYAPTQILAGAIKSSGFDGIAYKSSFGGEGGYNLALFGTIDVKLVSGHLYQVKEIKVEAEESGNPWHRKKEAQ